MRLTPQRIGQVLGFIFANVVSPSWLVLPLCFGALMNVTHVDMSVAFENPDMMLSTAFELREAMLANPLPVFSVLIGCFLLMTGMGLGYTFVTVRVGGMIATWTEQALADGIPALPAFFQPRNTLVSLD